MDLKLKERMKKIDLDYAIVTIGIGISFLIFVLALLNKIPDF